MKYVFILNSYTIYDKCEDIIRRISNYCINNNIDYIIEVNDSNNSTESILDKYSSGNSIIIAVGGDGMINRVLNSIVNTNNILGFIPIGTGNDFYRSVKLQCKDRFNDVDLIKINDKYFINVACFGIDADIANDKSVMSSKLFLKKYKYIISLIKHFYKYSSREFRININGKKIKDKFVTIVICNGMYYGGGFNIGPNSLVSNGLIDVYIVNDVNKLKMLNLILKMKNGKHEGCDGIEKYNVKNLIIKSKNRVKCNIDGEVLEDNIFKVKVLEKKQKLYFNQDMIDSILK